MSADTAFLDKICAEIDRLLILLSEEHPTASRSLEPPGLLIALSGGADSTALLLAAAAWRDRTGRPVEAVHVNHLLRGPDSDGDAAFCGRLCERLGVGLHTHRADPRGKAEDLGRNLEEAARMLRIWIFDDLLLRRRNMTAVATGHHSGDQLETLVMRFFRGAGASGMRGILPLSGHTIHPMLVTDREEIESFLNSRGQAWCEDATNRDDSNLRGKLRSRFLPMVRDIFGESALVSPLRLADLLSADVAELDESARSILDGLHDDEDGTDLPVEPLCRLPRVLASRVIRLFLWERFELKADLDRATIDRLLDWLPESRSGTCIDLFGGWRAHRVFDRLDFEAPYHVVNEGVPCSFSVHATAWPATDLEHDSRAPEPGYPALFQTGLWRLTMPLSALCGKPRVRHWRPGDRMVPFGMNGHKKISDLLREQRVPARARGLIHLVEDDEGPLWLVGLVRAERTRMLPSTTSAVTLQVLTSLDFEDDV